MPERKNPVFLRVMIIVVALFLGLSLNMFQFRDPFRNMVMNSSKPEQAPEPARVQVKQETPPTGPTESQTLPKADEVSLPAAAPAQPAKPDAPAMAAQAVPAQAVPEGANPGQPQAVANPAPAPAGQQAMETVKDNALSVPPVTNDAQKVRSAKIGRQVPADTKSKETTAAMMADASAPAKDAAASGGKADGNAQDAGKDKAESPVQGYVLPQDAPGAGNAAAKDQARPKDTPKDAVTQAKPGSGQPAQVQFTAPDSAPKPDAGAKKAQTSQSEGTEAAAPRDRAAKTAGDSDKSAVMSGGKVLDIKTQDKPGEFVLTITTDAPVERVTSFHAKGPARLAVDLWGPWQPSGAGSQPVESELMEKIRLGAHPDKLRLVIDYRDKELAGFSEPVIEKTPKGVVVRVPKGKTGQ